MGPAGIGGYLLLLLEPPPELLLELLVAAVVPDDDFDELDAHAVRSSDPTASTAHSR
jgi:hypothetical protein